MHIPTTIVYVDDDLDDQELLRDSFRSVSSHDLQTFSGGEELFAYLQENHQLVCLIVLDINLPQQDGIELVKRLKASQHFSIIPVVMLTTGANSPQAKVLREMNIQIIEKPPTFQEMQDITERLLQLCSK